jgi:hypothetical protein
MDVTEGRVGRGAAEDAEAQRTLSLYGGVHE